MLGGNQKMEKTKKCGNCGEEDNTGSGQCNLCEVAHPKKRIATKGLASPEMKAFIDLVIRANNTQLRAMQSRIEVERVKRI